MSDNLAKDLKALGSGATAYIYEGPDKAKGLLEHFPSPITIKKGSCDTPFEGQDFKIKITAPEFTSLCPKTGQPDYAEIYIEYTPTDKCVESKSLKLYLGSFRMHGEFHEACVARIAKDLIELLDPAYIKVVGRFTPRGGIKFWPVFEYWA